MISDQFEKMTNYEKYTRVEKCSYCAVPYACPIYKKKDILTMRGGGTAILAKFTLLEKTNLRKQMCTQDSYDGGGYLNTWYVMKSKSLLTIVRGEYF